MHTSAGRIAVSVLASVACLCAIVACGSAPLTTTAPAVMSMSEAATQPPVQVIVHAAETANAVAFLAQTAEAQARALTALHPLTASVRVSLSPMPLLVASPASPPRQTPIPATPTTRPTLGPAPGGYTAAFPLISAADLIQRPQHFEGSQFSVIGYVYNVHARMGYTTFYLASDQQRTDSIFVSLDGVDHSVQENAQLQVYGTGAKTIRVVTDGNVERESPFVRAVLVRSAR